jgi:hypothetical protein
MGASKPVGLRRAVYTLSQNDKVSARDDDPRAPAVRGHPVDTGRTHPPRGLSSPRQVVFDEVTFGKFVQAYCCTGERFFDIHPPIGKLLIAAAAKLGGLSSSFQFETIGQSYGTEPVWALRLVPALMGTLISVDFFLVPA